MSPARVALALAVLAQAVVGWPAAAAHIDVNLSIKYILDQNGDRPAGFLDDEQNIRDVVDRTTFAMERWGRGYRYTILGDIEEVAGASQFFQIGGTGMPTNHDLEDAARANPTQYHWRNDAVNVYIVACCAAGATIPTNPDEVNYRIVFISSNANDAPTDPGQNARQTLWAHELGHHANLIHPWDGDGVADTRPEPSPFQCGGPTPPNLPFPCGPGGDECCCTSKVANLAAAAQAQGWSQQEFDDLRFNVMGYNGAVDCFALGQTVVTVANMRLTSGQLDRWTDATRQYHFDAVTRFGEVTGLTWFVDAANTSPPFNGYSTAPYTTVLSGLQHAYAGGGDIVLIRAGNYAETLTINQPVTLRASRGVARIGPP